jgi:hypothetical protein
MYTRQLSLTAHTRVRDGDENASGCPKRRAPHVVHLESATNRGTLEMDGWGWARKFAWWPLVHSWIGLYIRHLSMLAKSGWQEMEGLIYDVCRRSSCVRMPFINTGFIPTYPHLTASH